MCGRHRCSVCVGGETQVCSVCVGDTGVVYVWGGGGRQACSVCGCVCVCVCVDTCVSERMFKLLRCVMGCPAWFQPQY